MQDIDLWDIQMFGLSQNEAMQTDPFQRLLMASAYTLLLHGGESTASVSGCDRSVVVGISSAEYASLLGRFNAPVTPYTSLTGSLNVACGRLSYTFGYTGPCLSVDTICSASLMSTHLGSRMLISGDCESSLAAGVNVMLNPAPFMVLVIANMLASDGRCKTLDQSGDGYVRSEACGMVEMESAAEDAGRVLVLVQGSAANQDGRSSSLTAPNGPSQLTQQSMALCLEDSMLQ